MKLQKPIIAISVYVYNLLDLRKKIQEVVNCGAKWIHVDIMDGKFVENYAFGQKMIHDIKESFPNIIIDAHLACDKPELSIESFGKSGCDYFIFHYEGLIEKSVDYIISICQKIHANNMKSIIAFNNKTELTILETKIRPFLDGVMLMTVPAGGNGQVITEEDFKNQIKRIEFLEFLKNMSNGDWLIMTDGSCRENTYQEFLKAGAEVIVVGAFVNVESDKIQTQIDKIQNYGKVF